MLQTKITPILNSIVLYTNFVWLQSDKKNPFKKNVTKQNTRLKISRTTEIGLSKKHTSNKLNEFNVFKNKTYKIKV